MLTQTLTNYGLKLTLEQGRLAVTPKAKLTDDLRNFIRVNKQQLISELQKGEFENILTLKTKVNETLKSSDLPENKNEKLHEVLNGFIENGMAFEVATDGFTILDSNQKLKDSDKDFLKINEKAILVTLQQSLLMKHLFSYSPFLLEDFAFEIDEREAIQAENGNYSNENYNQAVQNVTRKWFDDLLKMA